MKRKKKKDPVSERYADSGPFCYDFDRDLRTISERRPV